MKHYDVVVIGFGKAGKTLAKELSSAGKRVALIEQSAKMYGGACINTACIPSKTLLQEALKGHSFEEAMFRKNNVVQTLNQKNYDNLAEQDNIDLYTLKAHFESAAVVELSDPITEALIEKISAEHFIINTGSRPNLSSIVGMETVTNVYDSEGLMELEHLPNHLIIIGAGYIALEMATLFSALGSKVTILHRNKHVLSKEERAIGEAIYTNLLEQGIQFVDEVQINHIEPDGKDNQWTHLNTSKGSFKADAVLLATGRVPNTDHIRLDLAGVEVNHHSEIIVNQHLQTSQAHIYAVGDVKGGPQFTYLSLDDSRIVKSHLLGDASRTTESRGEIPYTLFLDPPLSRVGFTASAARKAGHRVIENTLQINALPRHHVDQDSRGLFKVVVDAETHLILGASLYGKQSEELINLIKLVMDAELTYDRLRDQIYTHPTMAESFNDLFNF